MGTGKASASEPLLTCRNIRDGIETGEAKSLRDGPGGCPSIGQVVPGMQAARAWSAAPVRNVGRPVPICLAASLARTARGSASTGRIREALSTDAASAGGPARRSDEAPVIGVERRGWLIRELFARATGGGEPALGGDEWASRV